MKKEEETSKKTKKVNKADKANKTEKTEKLDKKNKTKKIVLIIGVILLILILAFLYWFFNRKFEVTFKVSENEKYTVKVKYNQTIKEKDIKKKEELGDDFIDWYEVKSTEKGKDVLAKDSFDFSTKIKKNKKLKAVYKVEETEETITITFDTRGGSDIDSITINKDEALTLPEEPTKKGYTFKGWELEDETPINDDAKFEEDTTLYALWEKVKEVKKEEVKKEEKISLSLSRNTIHRNGYNTSKAVANVENASGDVTYSVDSTNCVEIDKSTGEITAKEPSGSGTKVKFWLNTCAKEENKVIVTATLPSGKSDTATLYLEKDLVLYVSDRNSLEKEEVKSNGMTFKLFSDNTFEIEANQSTSISLGNSDASCTESGNSFNCTATIDGTSVTVSTKANQKLSMKYEREVN